MNTMQKSITQDKKRCRKCGKVQPLSEFWRTKRSSDGYYYHCQTCCNKDRAVGLNTWEQAESAVREMSISQAAIDIEKSKCQERIAMIEEYTDKLIESDVARIIYLEDMLKSLCEREYPDGSAKKRKFEFGSITFRGGVFKVSLNAELAKARIGKP